MCFRIWCLASCWICKEKLPKTGLDAHKRNKQTKIPPKTVDTRNYVASNTQWLLKFLIFQPKPALFCGLLHLSWSLSVSSFLELSLISSTHTQHLIYQETLLALPSNVCKFSYFLPLLLLLPWLATFISHPGYCQALQLLPLSLLQWDFEHSISHGSDAFKTWGRSHHSWVSRWLISKTNSQKSVALLYTSEQIENVEKHHFLKDLSN